MPAKAGRTQLRSPVLWEVRQSSIHGSGVFARRQIRKGTRIIEYVGEKLTKSQSEKRSRRQVRASAKTGDGAVYIFEINDDYDIDGNVEWNPARLINHSCDPNCEAVNEHDRIWIEAIRTIREGEELSYNYGYDLECWDEHPCRCGSKNCVGYIVRPGDRKKLARLIRQAARGRA